MTRKKKLSKKQSRRKFSKGNRVNSKNTRYTGRGGNFL